MRTVECRSCGTTRMIKPPKFQKSEYPDGISCHKCWSPTPSKSSYSVKVNATSSSSASSFPTATDRDSGMEMSCKYKVGDSVFIDTDKFGVLLCQILDSEAWGFQHIFYTLDAKGTSIDYVEETEMFETAEEAKSSKYELVIPD